MDAFEKRSDGFCARCGKELAVTRDGLFCRRCLTAVVREANPDVRTIGRQGTDVVGRRHVSSATLGGAPDMRTTEEQS